MNELTKFNYEGSEITFDKGANVMVNATEMAKPFTIANKNKTTYNWLRNARTKEFLAELSDLKKIRSVDLVQVTHGDNGGTWMHEDVALEFARWLNPKFAIWCNDRIKELARHGFTATPQTLEQIIDNPDLLIKLATQLKQEREENARLLNENESQKVIISQQTEEIKKSAPKVEYYENTLQSVNTYTTTQIAKELGYNSANILNGLLRKAGIQFYQSGVYMLHVPYNSWRLHSVKTYTFTRNDGSIGTKSSLVWTERGRYFINALHKHAFDVKLTIKYLKGEKLYDKARFNSKIQL